MADKLTNIAAANAAAQAANMAAQQEYLRMRLYLLEIPEFQLKSLEEQDQVAFQWAQFAWQTGFQTATLTGKIPAGGLQLQMPNVTQLRSLYGVTAPTTSTTPMASGSYPWQTGGTSGGFGGTSGGFATSGGSPEAVKAAIMATGKQNIGGLPLNGTIGDADVTAWFQNLAEQPHSELGGGTYNLADFAGVAQAAAAAGYGSALNYYQSKVQPTQQQAPTGAPGGTGSTSPFTSMGMGGGPSFESEMAVRHYLINAGLSDWMPNRPDGTLSQAGFNDWLAEMQGRSLPADDPRMQQAMSIAAQGGYDISGYNNWYQTATGQSSPFAAADLGLPGLAPGETPTLDYIKLMAQLQGSIGGKPTLEAQIAQGNVGGMPTLEAQQLAGWVSPVQTWRNTGPWGESGWYDQYGNPLLLASQGGTPDAKPYDMIPTLQREQIMAELSGYMPGANGTVGTTPTLARESEYNQRAIQLLQLAASLQADPFRMAITLGQTPNGLADILSAASGRLNLPGYTAGTQGQPYDLATFAGDVQSMAGNPIQTTPAHVQAPVSAYNYEVNANGSMNQYPPGTTAPENRTQVSSTSPLNYQQAIQSAMQSVPYTAPSQVAPQAYNDMLPSSQKLLWQSYQMSGLTPEAAEASYKASLPQYAAQDPTGRVLIENR